MSTRTGVEIATVTNAFVADSRPLLAVDASFVAIPLHHSYLEKFAEELDANGLEGLYSEWVGLLAHQTDTDRAPWELVAHANTSLLSLDPTLDDADAPADLIGFTQDAPHRVYNWELFVHVPLRIAERLKEQGHYAEALRWLRFVMDPAAAIAQIDEAWRPRPLWDPASFTDPILKNRAWTEDPFDVHGIAENDPQVYRYAVARQYVETLLAWGDDLFSQDTMASIAEATQIYLLALDFLGPRPMRVELRTDRGSGLTFADLRALRPTEAGQWNPLTEMENLLTPEVSGEPTIRLDTSSIDASATIGYFCEPENDRHLRLWDMLDDRLFKIRHCMNIDGVVRTLPIFEPPIDPGALVAAAAAGLDLSQIQPTRWVSPHVRFGAMLGLAKGLAQSVQRLSGALLQAMQSRDGEALSVLRQQHEIQALQLADDVRRMQVDEARLNQRATEETQKITQARHDHYQELIEKGLLPAEDQEEEHLDRAAKATNRANALQSTASTLAMVPELTIDLIPKVTFGGLHLTAGVSAIGSGFSYQAANLGSKASDAARKAGRTRRAQEWKLQKKLAQKELTQIAVQIDAAAKRVEIAARELSNHRKQVASAQEVDRLLRTRFTNQELYSWTVGQLTQLHSRTFQLALEVARKAEVSFRRELGVVASSYVGASHWNASRKGLLAGDKLLADLERMEVAFVEQDRRELEITKHVSLKRLDPGALLALKATGTCAFVVPEVLFDLDFPGHYLRRIKAVSVSVPAVSGPYEGLNATLVLTSSEVRTDPDAPYDGNGRTPERWTERVALSGGQQDGGLFTFDLRDPKYLPFEHRGVISSWTLEFAGADPVAGEPRPQFDWNSISDVVMHVRYTARHDPDLVAEARGSVASALEAVRAGAVPGPLQVGLSFREDAPDAWAAFLKQNAATTNPVLAMSLDRSRLQYVLDALGPTVSGVQVVLWCAPGSAATGTVKVGINSVGEADQPPTGSVPLSAGVGGQPTATHGYSGTLPAPGATQQLSVQILGLGPEVRSGNFVDPAKLLDIVVLLDLDFGP